MCGLELFECPRHAGGLRLTPQACAKLWKRGRAALREEPSAVCKGCPIGAEHAGCRVECAPSTPDRICPRCLKSAVKFVKSICVSCYNREREIRVGKDRRGRPPVYLRRPVPMAVQVLGRDGVEVYRRMAVSRLEVMLVAAAENPDPNLVFARAIPSFTPQLTFWGGA